MAHVHAQSLLLAVKPVTPALLAKERSERDTLRSVQSRIVYILLASERSERDNLRSVQLRIVYICNSYKPNARFV